MSSGIHRAAFMGQKGVMSELLDGNPSLLNEQDDAFQGGTPLMVAVNAGHKPIVNLLIERGADLSAKNNEGNSALHFAAMKGHKATIQLLVDSGANKEDTNGAGKKPVELARAAIAQFIDTLEAKGAVEEEPEAIPPSQMPGKAKQCSQCRKELPKASFTAKQWRKGAKVRACNACRHLPLNATSTPAAVRQFPGGSSAGDMVRKMEQREALLRRKEEDRRKAEEKARREKLKNAEKLMESNHASTLSDLDAHHQKPDVTAFATVEENTASSFLHGQGSIANRYLATRGQEASDASSREQARKDEIFRQRQEGVRQVTGGNGTSGGEATLRSGAAHAVEARSIVRLFAKQAAREEVMAERLKDKVAKRKEMALRHADNNRRWYEEKERFEACYEAFKDIYEAPRSVDDWPKVVRVLDTMKEEHAWSGLKTEPKNVDALEAVMVSLNVHFEATARAMGTRNPFAILSDEIIVVLLGFLDYSDLVSMTAVNRDIRRVAEDNMFWPRWAGAAHGGHKELKREVRRLCRERNLVYTGQQAEKMMQLHQTADLNHGLMIVCPSAGGTPSAWEVLLKALEAVDGRQGVSYVVDPNADLFGSLDPNTREWSDGLVTAIVRAVRNNAGDELSKRHWVIFAGEVDPMWVENVNAHLEDDNKMLALPNGERLSLPSCVRFIFEVQGFFDASLATDTICNRCEFIRHAQGGRFFNHLGKAERWELAHNVVERQDQEQKMRSEVRAIKILGRKEIAVARDSMLQLYSTKARKLKLTLTGHMDTITCMDGNDSLLITGSADRTVKIWGGYRQLASLTGHKQALIGVGCVGSMFASADKGSLKTWSSSTTMTELVQEVSVSLVDFVANNVILTGEDQGRKLVVRSAGDLTVPLCELAVPSFTRTRPGVRCGMHESLVCAVSSGGGVLLWDVREPRGHPAQTGDGFATVRRVVMDDVKIGVSVPGSLKLLDLRMITRRAMTIASGSFGPFDFDSSTLVTATNPAKDSSVQRVVACSFNHIESIEHAHL